MRVSLSVKIAFKISLLKIIKMWGESENWHVHALHLCTFNHFSTCMPNQIQTNGPFHEILALNSKAQASQHEMQS